MFRPIHKQFHILHAHAFFGSHNTQQLICGSMGETEGQFNASDASWPFGIELKATARVLEDIFVHC